MPTEGETVWVQASTLGFRLPKEDLEKDLAEWSAQFLSPGDSYAIHAGDCRVAMGEAHRSEDRLLVRIVEPGFTVPSCSCTPETRLVLSE